MFSVRAGFGVFLAARVLCAQGVIQTVAGTDWLFPDNGKPAIGAALGVPAGLAFDQQGNLYIADSGTAMVFRVGTDGVIRVFAGNGIRGYSGDGGPATSASLTGPQSVMVDAQGNVYIGETAGRIRKVTPDGVIHLVAKAGSGGAMSFDSRGNLYFPEGGIGQVIRRMDPQGVVTTIAGDLSVKGYAGDGGPAAAALFGLVTAVAVGPDDSLYIADSGNRRIRRIDNNGIINTFAGNGILALSAAGLNGPATQASIGTVLDLIVDSTDVYFISRAGGAAALMQVDTQGILRALIPATFPNNFSPSGIVPGLARNSSGAYFVSEGGLRRVRRLLPSDSVVAGDGEFRGSRPGAPPLETILNEPMDVFADTFGNVFISEQYRVRKIAPDGTVSTVVGTGRPGQPREGDVAASSAIMSTKVTADRFGNVFVSRNGAVARIDSAGIVTSYPSPGNPAQFGLSAMDLATDAAGNLFVADSLNHRVVRITPGGLITTFAGNGVAASTGDGGPAVQASVNKPTGVAVDASNNVFIIEEGNRIRRVAPDGIISTVALISGGGGAGDIAVDAAGTLYVAHQLQHRVFVVSAAGVVLSSIGTGTQGFSGDGGPGTAAFLNGPQGVSVDALGRVYIADTSNHRIRAVNVTAPVFQVSKQTLSFSAASGGAPSPPQTFDVSASVIGLAFSAAASANWLSVTPAAGAAPGRVSVTANPAGLVAGTYQATLTVTAPAAVPAVRTLVVTFNVTEPAPPALRVEPAGLSFTTLTGSPATSQQLRVVNTGSGSVPFTVSSTTVTGGPWLRFAPGSANATAANPAVLLITADPHGLNAGTYTGRVTISSPGFAAIDIPVTLAVTAAPQRILLSQAGLTFTAIAGSGPLPPQGFSVLNGGSGTLNWSAVVSTLSGGPQWLTLSSTSGSSTAGTVPQPVSVLVDPTGLGAGSYYGRIEVSGVAANSPQTLVVVLSVLAAGQDPGPQVQPSGLVFTGQAGAESGPSSQAISISSLTAMSFNSSASTTDGSNWIVRVPPNGPVEPGSPLTMLVQPDINGLAAGTYQGTVTLGFDDGSVRTVAIVLVLAGSGSGAAGSRPAAGCAPTRLVPVVTTLGSNFNVAAAWPVAVVARVVDDCGAALMQGSVVASFTNGDPPIQLTGAGGGNWSATWTPLSGTGSVTVNVNAESSDHTLAGSASVTGGLSANPDPPAVPAGAILSAASYESQAPLPPGGFASIFGSKLSDAISEDLQLPFETQRAGTEIIVAGQSLPIHFTSAGQVNAIFPYGLAVNTTHQLIVMRGNTLSVPQSITVAPTRPAVFATNAQGFGQGHIYVSGPGGVLTLADAVHPAAAGDVIVLYAAGLGAVDPPVPAGTATPPQLFRTTNEVTATIGGVAARVDFAGLAPYFAAGLYQVNITVPDGVTPGSEVPLVLIQNGQPSPPVTMAVK